MLKISGFNSVSIGYKKFSSRLNICGNTAKKSKTIKIRKPNPNAKEIAIMFLPKFLKLDFLV
jgi:hypothetical protein